MTRVISSECSQIWEGSVVFKVRCVSSAAYRYRQFVALCLQVEIIHNIAVGLYYCRLVVLYRAVFYYFHVQGTPHRDDIKGIFCVQCSFYDIAVALYDGDSRNVR